MAYAHLYVVLALIQDVLQLVQIFLNLFIDEDLSLDVVVDVEAEWANSSCFLFSQGFFVFIASYTRHSSAGGVGHAGCVWRATKHSLSISLEYVAATALPRGLHLLLLLNELFTLFTVNYTSSFLK